MDLNYTEEEHAFRRTVSGFLECALPNDLQRKVIERRPLEKDDVVRWQRILNAQGWATPSWPVDHGGQAWTPTQRYIFQEEMALAHAPEGSPFNINMIGPIICRFGTEAQKRRFLARIANLDDWWCQGFSEPEAGSDLASLKTRADRAGEHYVLNGQKIWTTQAQHADWMFALVRTDASGRKQQGITFLLIDMTSPGITVRPIETIDGEHDLNEVFFDNVRVPVENRIGEEGRGWDYAKHLLGNERSGIARVGSSKERLVHLRTLEADLAREHVLSECEARRFKRQLTEVEVELRALELTQLRAITAASEGDDAARMASILKIKGTELQQRMTELMLGLAGAAGPALPQAIEAPETDWTDVSSRFYLTMRKVSIFGGANEIQKNIIAKSMLGI